MASRRAEKEQARARRLAAEHAATLRTRRTRRLQMLSGVVLVAVVIVVVAIVISSGGGRSGNVAPDGASARAAQAHVAQLLDGIPQSGTTLGRAGARVTVTEYGDLECSVCDMLATPPAHTDPEGESGTGLEDELIDRDVRRGTVKLVYRSLETASQSNPDPSAFDIQQEAADAAGLQDRAWNYIELFYEEQGAEGTGYVTGRFLTGLAEQVPGLDLARWRADRGRAGVQREVAADQAAGTAADSGRPQTPTLVIQGPDGRRTLPPGLPSDFAQIQTAIRSVD